MFSKVKMNRCRKKVIPWHVQQRCMESFSQLSFNQSNSAALYVKKIKSLQRNNKHLALALQRSRYLATDKENLLIENGKILDIINFSRVKLTDMAINMKQATECLDETLLLLNSSLTDSLSKNSPNKQNYKNDFKNKLEKLSRNSPIAEVSENSNSSNKNDEFYALKGKISRVDGCDSSPNKKFKLTKKGRTVRTNCKDQLKSAEEYSSTLTTAPKNRNGKNSKKCGSALNIKSQNRKKSSPKNSNIKSASSSNLSNGFIQIKTKQESLNNKRKAVKVILTDIAEAFLTQETENYHSPVKNGPTSSNSSNLKCFTPNSPEDDILIKKYFSSELTSRLSSASNYYNSQLASVNNAETPHCSQNTLNSSNVSCANLSSGDVPEIDEKSPALSSITNEDFECGQNSPIVEMQQIKESCIGAKQNNRSCIKKCDSEKAQRSYKSHNSKVTNRVHFYFDEEAIVKVEGNTVASKDRIRKSINKCKARKTVSHKKKNIPSESTAVKSDLILPDNVSKLGKNSFLVTAEVHSPPNGNYTQEIRNNICVSKKMEPCVVLTDIFKSNRGLLSEMVGNGLRENGCLQKNITKTAETPLAEMNTKFVVKENSTFAVNENSPYNVDDLNDVNMNCEKAENRCLPEDREIIKQGKQHRRSKIVSYKEPPLNVKMRRLF